MPKHLFICAIFLFCFSGRLWAQFDDRGCEKYYFSETFGQVGNGASPSILELDDGNIIVSWLNYQNLNALKLSPGGDVIWHKIYPVPGGTSNSFQKAIVDYDGNILYAVAKGSFLKTDLDGNYLSGKITGNPNPFFIEDIVMLPDGDKIIRYISVYGNSIIARVDKDLNVAKWNKRFYFYHYQSFTVRFSNLLVDGNDILLAGGFRQINSSFDYQTFITKIDAATGDTSAFRYYEIENSFSYIDKLYKTNTGYLANCYLSPKASEGNSGYIRFDKGLNILQSRRLLGSGVHSNFSFLTHDDGSFHVTYGGLWDMSLALIDGKDSIRWVKDLPGFVSYPSQIMESKDGSLFILGLANFNLVVGNIQWSDIYLVKSNRNGFAGNCQLETTPTLNSFDLGFFNSSHQLQISEATDYDIWKEPGTFTLSPLESNIEVQNNCYLVSVCNLLKLIGSSYVCSNDPVSITARTNEGCKTPVNWSVSPAGGFSMDEKNDSTISLSFHQSGVYKIYGSIALPCGEPLIDSMEISVNLMDKLDLGSDTTICDGIPMRLSAGNQFKSYVWQDGSGDSVFTAIKPGKYFVSVEDFCGNTYPDTILLTAPAAVLSHQNDQEVCMRDTIHLSAPSGFTEYSWTSSTNAIVVTGQTITDAPNQNTSYYLQVKTTESCFLFDTIKVTVNTIPQINLGKDTVLCEGESIVLNAGPGFSQYVWNTGHTNASLEVSKAGIFSVRVTDHKGCANSDTIIVDTKQLPPFYLGNDTTLCEGTALQLTINLPDVSYLWSTGSTSSTIGISEPGTYWAKAEQGGCSKTDTIHVAFSLAPSVYLGGDTTLCEGQNLILDASWPGASYLWNDGFGGSMRQITKSGTYMVATSLSSCISRDTITVNFISAPKFSPVNDTVICRGETLLLTPKASGQNVSYVWQDGYTGNEQIIRSPGNYRITASNLCGVAFQNIRVTEVTCSIYLPDAFTPNNDGLNDIFRLIYPGQVKEFEMKVYNRYGNIIFKTNDPYTGWDGRYKGEPQPVGVYVWTMSFADKSGKSQNLKGTVSLIR